MISEKEIKAVDSILLNMAKRDGRIYGWLGYDETYWSDLASKALKKGKKKYNKNRGASFKHYVVAIIYKNMRNDVVDKIRRWLNTGKVTRIIPIDEPADSNDDDDRTKAEVISNPDSLTPEEIIIKKEEIIIKRKMKQYMYQCVEKLPERNRKILKKYYGIDNEIKHTQAKIAREFNLTRERIGQIVRDSRLNLINCLSRLIKLNGA